MMENDLLIAVEHYTLPHISLTSEDYTRKFSLHFGLITRFIHFTFPCFIASCLPSLHPFLPLSLFLPPITYHLPLSLSLYSFLLSLIIFLSLSLFLPPITYRLPLSLSIPSSYHLSSFSLLTVLRVAQ